jgi:hypothetical protein
MVCRRLRTLEHLTCRDRAFLSVTPVTPDTTARRQMPQRCEAANRAAKAERRSLIEETRC